MSMYPPNAKLTRVVDAASEPLSLAEAKKWLKMEFTDADDDLIGDLITAARLEAERLNDRSFITTTWRWTLDFLPFTPSPLSGYPGVGMGWNGSGYGLLGPWGGSLTLPMPPLIALSSISYIDMDGDTSTIDLSPGSRDIVVSPGTPGRIAPGYGQFFPFSQPRIAAVDITYTAGYGPDATAVPKSIKTAIRFLLAHYYEHRTSDVETPQVVLNLLNCTGWGGYA